MRTGRDKGECSQTPGAQLRAEGSGCRRPLNTPSEPPGTRLGEDGDVEHGRGATGRRPAHPGREGSPRRAPQLPSPRGRRGCPGGGLIQEGTDSRQWSRGLATKNSIGVGLRGRALNPVWGCRTSSQQEKQGLNSGERTEEVAGSAGWGDFLSPGCTF